MSNVARRRRESEFGFEDETRRSPGGHMFLALQLLLEDLIDSVQALGAQQSNKSDLDGLPQSVTGQLTAQGVADINNTPHPNSIKCKAQFQKPTPVTVQFWIDTLGVFPQATISWKLGGNTVTRVIDVTPGCSISGFAEEVNVSVADQTNQAIYGGAGGAVYNCVITVAPGARPPNAVPPIYTGAVAANLNSGATKIVQVPLGASGVQVYGVSGGGAAQLRLDQYTSGSIGGAPPNGVRINSAEIDAYADGYQALIAGTSQIQITNEGGSAAVVTVIFAIDG